MSKKNNSKKSVKGEKKIILELFYMTPRKIENKDITNFLFDKGIKTEIWEDMNIFQIVGNGDSGIDFEKLHDEFEHSSDAAFVKNRSIQTIYTVTVDKDDFILLKGPLKLLLQEFEGFLCTDSEDFRPIYSAGELDEI